MVGDNMYAQLDFTGNRYKKVNLIGGEEVGIVTALIEQYPLDFINLEGREDNPLDTLDWYYDSEVDKFITTSELPIPEPTPITPSQPTNSEVAQMISDLQADLIIAGVI